MLWKELYIERVASLGRFGRWLGVLITLGIGGASIVLATMIVFGTFISPGSDLSAIASRALGLLLNGFAGTMLGWLLQWGVGLRSGRFDRLGTRARYLGRPPDVLSRTQ